LGANHEQAEHRLAVALLPPATNRLEPPPNYMSMELFVSQCRTTAGPRALPPLRPDLLVNWDMMTEQQLLRIDAPQIP
jgi:hypothetical protein